MEWLKSLVIKHADPAAPYSIPLWPATGPQEQVRSVEYMQFINLTNDVHFTTNWLRLVRWDGSVSTFLFFVRRSIIVSL